MRRRAVLFLFLLSNALAASPEPSPVPPSAESLRRLADDAGELRRRLLALDANAAACSLEGEATGDCTTKRWCAPSEANPDPLVAWRAPTGKILNPTLVTAVNHALYECVEDTREDIPSKPREALLESYRKKLEKLPSRQRSAVGALYAKARDEIVAKFGAPMDGSKPETPPFDPNAPGSLEAYLEKLAPKEVAGTPALADLARVVRRDLRDPTWLQWRSPLADFRPNDEDRKKSTRALERVKASLRGLSASGKIPVSPDFVEKMLSRLKVVDIDENDTRDTTCQISVASFDFRTGEMALCPSFHLMPEGSMALILAHELGHGLSPCREQRSVPAAEKKAWDDLSACFADPERFGMNRSDPARARASLQGLQSARAGERRKEDRARYDRRIARLSQAIQKAQSSSRPADCALSEFDEEIFGESDPGDLFARALRSDQNEETRADWIAAQVSSDIVQSLPGPEKKEFAEAVGGSAILKHGCDWSRSKSIGYVQALLRKNGCSFPDALLRRLLALHDDEDEHLRASKRLQLFYSEPALRSALGCKLDRLPCDPRAAGGAG